MTDFSFFNRDKKNENLIGVISDSHDNMKAIKKAVSIFNKLEVKTVFHAGDIISPITSIEFKKLNCQMRLIYGNNDGDKLYLNEKFKMIGNFSQDPFIGEIDNVSIAMTHHPELIDYLKNSFGIVIYGHTHEVDVQEDVNLIINPGECCGYVTGKRTIAIVDIQSKKAEIVEL